MSEFSLPKAFAVVRRSPASARIGVAVLLVLGGCSTVTSWFTPAPAPTRVSTQPVSGDKPYPNLASVPNQPPPVTTPAERKALVEGLSADRANAQYSEQALTDQPTGVAPAAPPAPAPPPAAKETAAAPPAETPPSTQTASAPPPGPPPGPPPQATQTTAAPPPPPPPATQTAAAPPPPAPAATSTQSMAEPPPPAPPPSAPAAPSGSSGNAIVDAAGTPGAAIPPIDSVEGPAQASAPEAQAPPATTAATPPPVQGQPAPMAAQPSPAAPAAQQMAAAEPAPAAPPPAAPAAAAPAASAPVETAPVQTAEAAPADEGPVLRNGSAVAMPGPGTAMGAIAGAPTVIATQLAAVPPAPAMPASSSGPVAVDMSALGESAPAPTAPAPVQTALASPRGQPAGVIYFHNGSASLSAKDRAVLRQIARLQRQSGAVIQVVGHASMWTRNTDLQRQATVNQNLSVVRAGAVARTLRQFGVSPGRIQTAAVGAQQPVYVESMPNGEAGNRRVEIYFGYN